MLKICNGKRQYTLFYVHTSELCNMCNGSRLIAVVLVHVFCMFLSVLCLYNVLVVYVYDWIMCVRSAVFVDLHCNTHPTLFLTIKTTNVMKTEIKTRSSLFLLVLSVMANLCAVSVCVRSWSVTNGRPNRILCFHSDLTAVWVPDANRTDRLILAPGK